MTIQSITESEFSKHVTKVGVGVTKEVAWYKSDRLDLIGTVFQDTVDKDWGYVILAKVGDDSYEPQDLGSSIDSQSTADRELFEKMLKIEEQ